MTFLADKEPVVVYLGLVCAIAVYLSVGAAVVEWWSRRRSR